MSAIETVENALLAKVTAQISTVSTQRGAKFIEDIPITSLPFAFTASPAVTSEAIDFEQRVRRTGINVVIVWKRPVESTGTGSLRAAVLNDVEAIETAIEETDPTLGAAVNAARVEGFFLDENPESNVYVGVLSIVVEERR